VYVIAVKRLVGCEGKEMKGGAGQVRMTDMGLNPHWPPEADRPVSNPDGSDPKSVEMGRPAVRFARPPPRLAWSDRLEMVLFLGPCF
jgi:hypothetical protein